MRRNQLKQSESNSLQRALAQEAVGPHPDADVLTAFSEDALLPREREQVLAHLAVCGECRQVLNLAGDAAEEPLTTGPLLVVSRKRTAWRIALPLLAAAAMLAVVTTVVVRSVRNRPAQDMAVVTRNTEVRADRPAPQAPSTQPPNKAERKLPAQRAGSIASRSAPVAALPLTPGTGPPASDAAKQAEALPAPPTNSSI